jgi:hypothetical protein
MYEITIFEMDDDNQTFIEDGIELPAPIQTIENTLAAHGADKPYRPYAYNFRLKCLDGRIEGTLELDALNAFAERLSDLSEYERVKLEGALAIHDSRSMSIQDCVAIIYNLNCYDLTPNTGGYEALGRQFAAQELTDVPPHLMELINYEQLGRLKHDDGMSVFVREHLVRDTGQSRREFNPDHDPLACPLKMRLCSSSNPDGVWVKFPLWFDVDEHLDTPELSSEMQVALAALRVSTLDECRAAECVCEYPSLNRCLETHAKNSLNNIVDLAQIFGYAWSELEQTGNEPYQVFAAAMEYEDCSNLGMAIDITQNLRCYDFAPDTESYANNYLKKKGVDDIIASCFDLKAIGDTLIVSNSAKQTQSGVISRNGTEFIQDYFHLAQESQSQTLTEIRLFCPLEVKTDSDSELGEEYGMGESKFGYAVISNDAAADFEDEILQALEKEHMPEEEGRGLAHYLGDEPYTSKVSYIWPTVEIWKGELWGVMEIKVTEALTPQEMSELSDWCLGQLSDGLGEGFEQRPVRTQQGDLYVSFWHSGGDYFLKPEQELKGMGLVYDEPEHEHDHRDLEFGEGDPEFDIGM